VSTTYKIHPGIGVARVGDSPHAFFVGPEAPGVPPLLRAPNDPAGRTGKYKDDEQRIKRQGARFRIFEYTPDAAGGPTHIREITAADADIEWEVHLVNRKSAAMSFPDGARRNSGLPEASLIIDAGVQTIKGVSTAMKRLQGRFQGVDIALGDLLTDEGGRLIALGGFGRSRSVPDGTGLVDFANNDGWCDDISDGPVRATVRLHGASAASAVDPAWLLVAPPDFAPAIENVVTLYDAVYAMMAKLVDPSLRVTDKATVSFTRDIYPILRRVSQMHFVSDVAAQGHGEGSFGHFLSAVQALSTNTAAGASLRSRIFGRLRNPAGGGGDMPKLPEEENAQMVGQSLTEVQYARMERWAQGKFDGDWTGAAPAAVALDRMPVSERPAALDRAALEGCVGGPFFPGIEVGRIVLEPATYDATRPFRFNPQLEPGTLTARMAVPWQADFHDCAFEAGADWWPGQRPIHVTRGHQRQEWMPRGWTKEALVEKWSHLGFVIEQRTASTSTFVEAERHTHVNDPVRMLV